MTTSTERDRHRGGLGRAVLTLFAQCRWQEAGQGRARQTPSWDGPCPAQFTHYLLKNKGWAGKRGQKRTRSCLGHVGWVPQVTTAMQVHGGLGLLPQALEMAVIQALGHR